MRVNTPRIRYNRDELSDVLFRVLHPKDIPQDVIFEILDTYEARRAEGGDLPCQSVVHHGPGHQSSTYCEAIGGDRGHDHEDGKIVHAARLPSGGFAEWTDERPYHDEW